MNDHDQLTLFLSQQKYMSLAVVLADGTPWVTPVRIKRWDNTIFEWDSNVTTEHSKALAKRPDIAISIWTPDGENTIQFGFYAQATAEQVGGHNDKGIARYRATVHESWVNDGSFIKRRVDLA